MSRLSFLPISLRVAIAISLIYTMAISSAWCQQHNDFNPGAPRAVRNDQGSQDFDQGEGYSRGYRDTEYRDQNEKFRRDQQDNSRQRSNQYSGPSQSDSSYSRNQQDSRNQQQSRNQDQPAGLGVMLDTSNGDLEVRQVARNSPAERAGIRRGDQIVSINGQRLDSTEQLINEVRRQQPGSQVDIRIRRDGEQRTLTAELESLRQALDTMKRNGSQQWEDQQNSPPWGDDQVMQHVDQLEQQVRRMQQEIDDLRSMLNTRPSEDRFSQGDRSQYRD